MGKLTVSLLVLALGAGLWSDGAEAARLGGGRSLGAQRQITTPPKQATPPAQQQPAAPQPSGAGRWLAPLAGLAAGLGLGWLFAQGGFAEVLGALLMALLAGAAVFAFMRILPRQQAPQTRYSGLGGETVAAPPPSQLHGNAGERAQYRGRFVADIPAGFDVERFLNEAKRNFVRLQEANDRGDLALLREVTTGDLFDALKDDLASHPDSQTDVVTLNAALLELVTEGGLHWASVRFSGSIREQADAPAGPFDEIWNLQKPADGSSGWLLAGIQQSS
ncbi:MAG TPA: Tim44-like domain-containing protein [Burkholderiales bacterium]|nr:Tim44-like domain-containing protein [Burkholderiales bacterium]